MCLFTVTTEVNEVFFPHQTQDTSTSCMLCSAEYRSICQEYACHLIFVFPHMLLFGRNDTRFFFCFFLFFLIYIPVQDSFALACLGPRLCRLHKESFLSEVSCLNCSTEVTFLQRTHHVPILGQVNKPVLVY